MQTRHGLMLLLLLSATGCGSNPVMSLIGEELDVIRELTKIFNGVKDDQSLDYAVAAMEQPCATLASVLKKRDELIAKMTPAQVKSLEATAEFQELGVATNKMLDAFKAARSRLPNRSQELVAVWDKTGLRARMF